MLAASSIHTLSLPPAIRIFGAKKVTPKLSKCMFAIQNLLKIPNLQFTFLIKKPKIPNPKSHFTKVMVEVLRPATVDPPCYGSRRCFRPRLGSRRRPGLAAVPCRGSRPPLLLPLRYLGSQDRCHRPLCCYRLRWPPPSVATMAAGLRDPPESDLGEGRERRSEAGAAIPYIAAVAAGLPDSRRPDLGEGEKRRREASRCFLCCRRPPRSTRADVGEGCKRRREADATAPSATTGRQRPRHHLVSSCSRIRCWLPSITVIVAADCVVRWRWKLREEGGERRGKCAWMEENVEGGGARDFIAMELLFADGALYSPPAKNTIFIGGSLRYPP